MNHLGHVEGNVALLRGLTITMVINHISKAGMILQERKVRSLETHNPNYQRHHNKKIKEHMIFHMPRIPITNEFQKTSRLKTYNSQQKKNIAKRKYPSFF